MSFPSPWAEGISQTVPGERESLRGGKFPRPIGPPWEEPDLHQGLEPVADPSHQVPGPEEVLQLVSQHAPEPGPQDGPRADVIAGGEASREEQGTVVPQPPALVTGHIPPFELLEVDHLRVRAQGRQRAKELLVAIGPLDLEDRQGKPSVGHRRPEPPVG
jgi:hypothetical protein